MKLKYLHNLSPEMDTTKMFVVSVLLSCVMRCLSFIAIGSLSLQSIKFDIDQNGASGRAPSGVSPDPDTDFYEKVRTRSAYVCGLCCKMCTLLYAPCLQRTCFGYEAVQHAPLLFATSWHGMFKHG
jgi:hypothetical protein